MFNKTKLLSKLCPWLLPCVAYIFRVVKKHIYHQITYIFQTKNEFLCRRRFSLPTDNSTCRTARGDARQVCEKRCTITKQKKVLPSKLWLTHIYFRKTYSYAHGNFLSQRNTSAQIFLQTLQSLFFSQHPGRFCLFTEGPTPDHQPSHTLTPSPSHTPPHPSYPCVRPP